MRALYFLFAFMFLFTACDENEPIIPCLSCITDNEEVEPEDRKVLIEEFTGVQCVQCPAGSVEIENLLQIHGERLVAVSIHAGFFSDPFNDSNVDFRTDEGEALNDFLDRPQSYPSAVINRKLFANEPDLQLTRASWAGFIAAEKESIAQVILDVQLDYDEAARTLAAESSITPIVDLDGDIRISVMILESNIVDKQKTPAGNEVDYVHKHALRTMLTPFDGAPITDPLTQGNPITRNHSMTVPTGWDVNNMSVVAFVHRNGDTREVLQAEEVDIAQ